MRALRLPRLARADTLERRLRVLRNDLDINGHMNNGRDLTLIDLMLVAYVVRCGCARVMPARGWRPMAGGSIVSYRRGLAPLPNPLPVPVRARRDGRRLVTSGVANHP